MLIIILAYLGGVLTIASPCIPPVLPFVFARSDQSFLRSGLPLLAGMALTFTLVATLAAVGGGWVVQANQYGRWLALMLMAIFGITLLFPQIGDRVMRPLVSAGNIMTAAAAGAVPSLCLALLIGGKVFSAMKRSLGAGEWIRRGIGAAMLLGVVAISLGLDTGFLTRLSTASTNGLEQRLLDIFGISHGKVTSSGQADDNGVPLLENDGPMPALSGAGKWLNSPPLTAESLRG